MELTLFVLIIFYSSSAAVPENVYGRKGSSYTFVCPHRKSSTDNVIWRFTNKSGTVFPVSEGTFLPSGNPARNRTEIVGDNSNGEYNLKLSGLQETDEGTYICIVSTDEKAYYLELLAAPSALILYNVVDNTIRGTEGRSLTINCTAIGGKPPPDTRLEVDSQVASGRQSVQYILPVLQRNHDKQLIKCRATSEALVSPINATASLYLYLKPSAPVFNPDQPKTTDTQPLVVTCTSTGSRPAGVVINLKVMSNPVTVGVVQQNTHDQSTDTYKVVSTLTYSVDRSYNGQPITCGVTHQTLSQAVEITKTISVYYAPDVTVSNKTHIQTDTTRTLQCNADGNPYQFTYYKWQHKSLYGVLIRELDGEQNGILTLPSIAESNGYQDSGIYICTVGNGIGDRSGKIKQTGYGYLTVNAQSVYTLDNNNKSTQYGEFGKSTDINVYVYSVPKYTQVTWYKGNTALPKNNKYDMTENLASVKSSFHDVAVQLDGYEVTLTISNLVEGDFTTYELRLSNGYGQTVHSVVLESASAPQTPSNFNITDSSVSSISFEWDAGFNGGHDQTFHVEYRVTGSTSWSAKEVPTKQQIGRQKFTLSGLEDSTSYEVRMYAENKFNKSLPTDFETILTVKGSQTSTGAIIGGIAVGMLFLIVVIIIVVYYSRKRGSVFRGQNKKSQRTGDAAYENQLNTEMYEQIDGAINESEDNSQYKNKDDSPQKTYEPLNMRDNRNMYAELSDRQDTSQSKTEDESSKTTYEPLNIRDNPNLYAELSDQEGQKQYYNPSAHYEALGASNKPNVYEDLENKKGIKEKEYVNMTF